MQVAKDAQERLSDEVEAAFDEPVSFSKIRTGKEDTNRTTVRRWPRRLPKSGEVRANDVETKIYVMQKQSTYFKYALGGRTRRPGDIGLSEDYVGIPIWHNLIDLHGIYPTRDGNLPKWATNRLHRRKSFGTMSSKEKGSNFGGRLNTTFFGTPKGRFGDVQEGWYDRPRPDYQRTGPVIMHGRNAGKRKLELVKGANSPKRLIAAHKVAAAADEGD